MDNLDDSELRLLKHPRWSPSPVDLSIANVVPPASALIASLGAAYYGSPNTPNTGYPLNGVMVSSPSSHVMNSRKQREFIPESKKDESYWDRRKRNNEAAKRSREKRRISDMVLEARVIELTRENSVLRAELYSIKEKFGLSQAQTFVDTDSMSMVDNTNRARRTRLLSNILPTNNHSDLNSNGNSSYNSSSSSPTSQSSSSSEPMISTPMLSANLSNISSINYSSQSMSTPEPICCGPTHNPICPIGSVTTATLPFKLRHKVKNNADSDSGSDICVNVLTDITTNHSVINNNSNNNNNNNNSNDNNNNNNNNNNSSNTTNNSVSFNENNGSNVDSPISPISSVLNDSLLKSENYALRSELQRLATEVASLKNVLIFNPTQPPVKSSNDSLHCNSYQRDSRTESPNLKSDTNEAINGSKILSNEPQSH